MPRLTTANLHPRLTRSRTLRSDLGSDVAATSSVASVTGGAATAGVSGGADTVGGASSAAPWDQFAAGIAQLNESLAPRLDALRSDVQRMPDALRPEPPAPAPPDYDSMTQSDLAAHILGAVTKSVESTIAKALEPVLARVSETQQAHFKSTVEAEMTQLQSANKDFADWKPQMVELARSHPTLGLKQLYALARAENPARASELSSKYNPAPPPPTRFGGLTPALGGAPGSAKPLSREDASREAYREVSTRHPGILAALETL